MSEVGHPGPRAIATPRPEVHDRAEQRALRFTALMMAMCILGQRFGLNFGSSALSFVGPLGLGLALCCLVTGTLALHKTRLVIYLGFITIALLQAAVHAVAPAALGVNIPSLAQFTLLTGFTVFTFRVPVDEVAFCSQPVRT